MKLLSMQSSSASRYFLLRTNILLSIQFSDTLIYVLPLEQETEFQTDKE